MLRYSLRLFRAPQNINKVYSTTRTFSTTTIPSPTTTLSSSITKRVYSIITASSSTITPPPSSMTKGASSPAIESSKWDLVGAICLERKPIIIGMPNETEKKMQQLLREIEIESSHKSDHEIRHELDKIQAEMLKKGDNVDVDTTLAETAQDFEDASLQELQSFKFADKITDDDKVNNLKSLNRKLNKHLVLLVKQKIGGNDFYLLPQALRLDGETLKQTAERILKETCPNVKANIYGNAPTGFYKYKYPKDVQADNGAIGAKVFMYFARYTDGEFSSKSEYKWLDRMELRKALPDNYHNSVTQFLIEE